MDFPIRVFDISWQNLSSNRIIRQLDVSYNRFYRNPLYRRWMSKAYEHRLATVAEEAPEKIVQGFTFLVIGIPVLAMAVQILFGSSTFEAVGTLFGVGTLMLAIFISVAGLGLSALLAATSVSQERLSGRWELLMLLPKERATVLQMRISSILYPYRPVIITLDVLQSIAAFLSIGAVGVLHDDNGELISMCFLFMLPCLLLLSWERRQDYVLSLMFGAFVGITYPERRSFMMAILGAGLVLSLRIMMTLLAFGLAGMATSLTVLLPAFIGGPAMLPIIGVPIWAAVGFLAAYYLLREGLITLIWQATVRQMESN